MTEWDKLAINERYWTLLAKETTLRCNLIKNVFCNTMIATYELYILSIIATSQFKPKILPLQESIHKVLPPAGFLSENSECFFLYPEYDPDLSPDVITSSFEHSLPKIFIKNC